MKFTICLFIILQLPLVVLADNSNKNSISYSEYLVKITKSLPKIKENKLNELSALNSIKKAKGRFDLELNADSNTFKQNQYNADTDNGNITGYSSNISLNKTISLTGTRLSTGVTFTKNKYDNVNFINTNSYQSKASIGITQPLLYNAFGKQDKFEIKNAEQKYEIEKIQREINDISILNYYKKLYVNWFEYKEILNLIDKSLSNAEKLKKQTLRKVKAGLADNDDYQRAVSSYINYQNSYQNYLTLLKTIEKEIFIYIKNEKIIPEKISFENLYKQASNYQYQLNDFDKTLSGKVFKLKFNNLNYTKKVYNNKLLPELNVYSTIDRIGNEDNLSNSSTEMNDTNYTVGFEFKYNFENNANESELEDVKLNIKNLNYQYQSEKNTYKINVNTISQNIESFNNIIKNKTNNIKVLRSQFKTEKKKYNQARLNLSYVLDTDNNITSAKIDLLDHKKEIIQNYIDYLDINE